MIIKRHTANSVWANTIYEDNQSCLKFVKTERLTNQNKYIDTKFVRDYINQGIVACEYCPTEKMIADLLTKPKIDSSKIRKT